MQPMPNPPHINHIKASPHPNPSPEMGSKDGVGTAVSCGETAVGSTGTSVGAGGKVGVLRGGIPEVGVIRTGVKFGVGLLIGVGVPRDGGVNSCVGVSRGGGVD